MTVTKPHAQMLATLAAASRPNGARRWDSAGVMAALEKVKDRDLAEVIMATVRAASDRDCETPGVIPSNGSHWRDTAAIATPAPQQLDNAGRCSVCSLSEPACAIRWSDHEFQSVAQATAARLARPAESVHRTVAAIKDNLVPTAPPPPARSLDDRLAAIPAEKRDPGLVAVRAAMAGEREEAHG